MLKGINVDEYPGLREAVYVIILGGVCARLDQPLDTPRRARAANPLGGRLSSILIRLDAHESLVLDRL